MLIMNKSNLLKELSNTSKGEKLQKTQLKKSVVVSKVMCFH